QEMLKSVVVNGTAKVVGSDYFDIAGKTGTAMIAGGGGYSGYYVSFCGYFPADEPMYTIFVGLRKPKGVPSGGGMAGMVFKNIAEQTYLRKVQLSVDDCRIDSTLNKEPEIKNGNTKKSLKLLSSLNLKVDEPHEDYEWVKVNLDSIEYKPVPIEINATLIPDVIGMGARDALYLLEKSGLKVNLNGSGKVVAQSLRPGQRLVKGSTVSVTLR
ncbi:MAG: PASTA domain-containing protein, partial [Bacteroidales bacterium]|nr:PASTA domain-containing protein [Bacteroidales bacterium]